VYDAAGKLLYGNGSVARTLASDPEGGCVRQEVERVARNLASIARARSADSRIRSNAQSEVRTVLGTYKISAVFLELGFASASHKVIVLLTAARAAAADIAGMGDKYRLSQRELQVAQLLRRGLGTRDVAACLGISVNTTRRHTENILAKLGVHSRAQAVATLGGG
jgi:DNA-binding CsgD family transcriptional regulator